MRFEHAELNHADKTEFADPGSGRFYFITSHRYGARAFYLVQIAAKQSESSLPLLIDIPELESARLNLEEARDFCERLETQLSASQLALNGHLSIEQVLLAASILASEFANRNVNRVARPR